MRLAPVYWFPFSLVGWFARFESKQNRISGVWSRKLQLRFADKTRTPFVLLALALRDAGGGGVVWSGTWKTGVYSGAETVAGAHKHVLHKDFTYSLIRRMLRMKVPCIGSVPEHSEPPYCLHRQHPNQNNTSKLTNLKRSTCAENHMKRTEIDS